VTMWPNVLTSSSYALLYFVLLFVIISVKVNEVNTGGD